MVKMPNLTPEEGGLTSLERDVRRALAVLDAVLPAAGEPDPDLTALRTAILPVILQELLDNEYRDDGPYAALFPSRALDVAGRLTIEGENGLMARIAGRRAPGAWMDEVSYFVNTASGNSAGYPFDQETSPLFDHSQCVPAGAANARSHTHEGKTGAWIFPDETGKGLYDESPTGAGF